jgi:hypothetical protein
MAEVQRDEERLVHVPVHQRLELHLPAQELGPELGLPEHAALLNARQALPVARAAFEARGEK